MTKKIPVLDTNVLIRFLTSDNKKQADQSEKLFKSANKRSLEIPDLIIAEIVYILLSYYNLSKEEVINKISILVEFEKFKINKKIIKKTLSYFKEANISFVDAYLCSLVYCGKNNLLYSFDRQLLKKQEIKVIAP